VPDEPPIYSTITTDFKIRTESCKLTTIWESGEDRKPYTGTDANGALAKRRRNAAARNRNRRRLKISAVAGSSRRRGDARGGQRADDRTYVSTTARILPRCCRSFCRPRVLSILQRWGIGGDREELREQSDSESGGADLVKGSSRGDRC
jgi:hypothetical protein